jgi:hypothetical protein
MEGQYLKEFYSDVCVGVDWINFAEDKISQPVLVNSAVYFQVPEKFGNFLNS